MVYKYNYCKLQIVEYTILHIYCNMHICVFLCAFSYGYIYFILVYIYIYLYFIIVYIYEHVRVLEYEYIFVSVCVYYDVNDVDNNGF